MSETINQKTVKLTMGLQGMTCAACANRIQKGLSQLAGVTEAVVNFATEKAAVTLDPAQVTGHQLKEKVESLGYHVVEATAKLSLVGMTCANCAQKIERKLNSLPGVMEATVNFGTETALVKYLTGTLDVDAMKKAVESLGYQAFAKEEKGAGDAEKEARERDMKRQWQLFLVSTVLTLPLLVYMFGELLGLHPPMIFMNPWFQLALATDRKSVV